MQKIVGVVGIGEVGTAISNILASKFRVLKKDLNYDEIDGNKLDVLHICLPFNDKFVDLVVDQIRKSKPKLIIIHSTVGVGTTREISKSVSALMAHSPVMGVHPSLTDDIKRFTKIIGAVDSKSLKASVNHLKDCGLKVEVVGSSEESELGKLLDTTYYGWNIIFSKLVASLCKKLDLDFENVYTKFNQVYNQGYQDAKPNVVRPILKNMPGKIGGHCVVPNAQILNDQFNLEITNFIIKQNEKLSKDNPASKK